jgi:putative transposase
LKKKNEYRWLNEVSGKVASQSFQDLQIAYSNYFKGITRHPKFKTKRRSKKSFYVRYDAIKFNDGKVNIEKIGKVSYKTNYDIPNLPKYSAPSCSYDGKYWYLSFGFEQEPIKNELTDISIGIDVGVKTLAICSNGMKFENINKTKRIRNLNKKLKRLQRRCSKKYECNKQGQKFVKTNNIIKLEKQIKLIHRTLNNIRKNYIHQTTNKIVKTKPSRVVMETLNIQGMMKNKHLAKSITEQCLFEFKSQMKYKCQFNGIEFIEADRWYPSSKTCSKCGHIKSKFSLSERTYICEECGCVIDRDYNASINLSRYELTV